MALIRITPDDLRRRAGDLRKLKDEHVTTFGKMDNLVNSLKGEWEGQALEAFTASFTEAKRELDKFRQSIEAFEANMITAADKLEQMDKDLATAMRK